MVFFLFLTPLLVLLRDAIPLSNLFSFSSQIHKYCLNQVSFKSEWIDIYRALLCGEKLPYGEVKSLFIRGGCIHLMVVSGAHLLFLERMWDKNPLPFFKRSLLFCILILYACASQLQPPVLRALFSFMLFHISQSKKLFWRPHFITHLSGILCLLMQPQWIGSISLQLSWLASFLQNLKTSTFVTALLTYLCISPIVNNWQELHPLTVFVNWLIMPIMATFLFPATLLSALFSPLRYITDHLWTGVLLGLKTFSTLTSSLLFPVWQLPPQMYWGYIIFIFSIATILDVKRRRRYSKK